MTPPPDRPAATPSRERVTELLRDYVARVRTTAAQQRHLTDAAFLLVREKEDTARAALDAALASLADDAARWEEMAKLWKGHAVALGVHGSAERDASRKLLTARIAVDEGVLRLGKADILTATLLQLREKFVQFLDEHAVSRSPIGETPEDPT